MSGEEALIRVLEYIDDCKTLGKCIRVSKRFKSEIEAVSNDERYWKYHADALSTSAWFQNYVGNTKPHNIGSNRPFCIASYRRARQIQNQQQADAEYNERYRIRDFLYKASAATIEIISVFAILIFVVLLSEKANSPSFASWHQVFLPLYILFGFNFAFMVANVVNLLRHPENPPYYFHFGIAPYQKTPTTYLLSHYGSYPAGLTIWLTFTLGLLWVLSISFYLESQPYPLFVIFLIPYILLAVLAIILCFITAFYHIAGPVESTGENTKEWHVADLLALDIIFSFLTLIVFFALLHTKLADPSKFTWIGVISPWFVAEGITVILLIFSLILIRDIHRPVYSCHALSVIVFYIPLLIAFQVMVAYKLDGEDLDWRAVFSPLYILTGGSFISYMITYCIAGILPPIE